MWDWVPTAYEGSALHETTVPLKVPATHVKRVFDLTVEVRNYLQASKGRIMGEGAQKNNETPQITGPTTKVWRLSHTYRTRKK